MVYIAEWIDIRSGGYGIFLLKELSVDTNTN